MQYLVSVAKQQEQGVGCLRVGEEGTLSVMAVEIGETVTNLAQHRWYVFTNRSSCLS